MKNRGILLLVFLALPIFGPHYIYAADEQEIPKKSSQPQEVVVYLQSGEILRGSLLEQSGEEIVLEKGGNKLTFNTTEVIRIEKGKSGETLTIKQEMPFKTAIITYENKGIQKGKETTYIDAVNNKVAIEREDITANFSMDMKSTPEPGIIIDLYDGQFRYNINFNKKEAIKTEQKGDVTEAFGEKFYLYTGGDAKKEQVLGRECRVYDSPMGKVYFWNGILLKQTMGEAEGSVVSFSKEAIDIKTDVPLPPEKFEIPKDFKIKSLNEQMKEMEEQSKKSLESLSETYKEMAAKQLEGDPDKERILKEITKEDGSIDFGKALDIQKEKDLQRLVNEAKTFPDGDQIVEKATGQDGKIEYVKLAELVSEANKRKWQEQELQQWKEDPELENILKLATNEKDGSIDRDKVFRLREEKETQQLVNEAKTFPENDQIIKEATGQDGKIERMKLSELVSKARERKWQAEKLQMFKSNPGMQDILKEATFENGDIDFAKVKKLRQKKEENELISKIKQLSDGEQLLKEFSLADGTLDIHALQTVLREREMKTSDKYQGLLQQGDALEEKGEYDQAVENYSQAIALNPMHAAGYLDRSTVYQRMGEYEKAIADLTQVIENLEGFSETELRTRAGLYAFLGKYNDALKDYSANIELAKGAMNKASNPDSFQTGSMPLKMAMQILLTNLCSRAEIYHRMGKNEQALTDLNEAMRLELDEKQKANAYFLRGLIYKNLGKDTEMKNDFEKAEFLGNDMQYGDFEGMWTWAREGNFVWYYSNGNLKSEGHYKHGEEDGLFKWYYLNGQLKEEGSYENGKENGTFILYNEDGSLKKKIIFENGVRKNEIYP